MASPALLNPAVDLDAFFARLRRAGERLLLLDYDGTLAPFRAARGEAVPYPEVQPLLLELSRIAGLRLVIISGRPLTDLVKLLGISPLPELWGSHGWERRTSDGRYMAPSLDSALQSYLHEAMKIVQSTRLADVCEAKPAGVAVHWRGLRQADRDAVRARVLREWPAIAAQSNLELHAFDGGAELRVKGYDKGHAVDTVLSEMPSNVIAAYLGDDQTDEDAFRALDGRGLRVLVRTELRPTAADVWIKPPEELALFLTRWIAACR
ncbi:MAG TPA: trehalose-phosphatase [Rhizomicrobium sp.]|nr:trehalose-phosphatase [Rhizomicrobium sp.]